MDHYPADILWWALLALELSTLVSGAIVAFTPEDRTLLRRRRLQKMAALVGTALVIVILVAGVTTSRAAR